MLIKYRTQLTITELLVWVVQWCYW